MSRGAATHTVAVMQDIERQASVEWGGGWAVATRDLMLVDIPSHELSESEAAYVAPGGANA